MKSNDKNTNGEQQNFSKSTNSFIPTRSTTALSIPPSSIGLMYLEKSGDKYGPKVYIGFKRTDIIQIR